MSALEWLHMMLPVAWPVKFERNQDEAFQVRPCPLFLSTKNRSRIKLSIGLAWNIMKAVLTVTNAGHRD